MRGGLRQRRRRGVVFGARRRTRDALGGGVHAHRAIRLQPATRRRISAGTPRIVAGLADEGGGLLSRALQMTITPTTTAEGTTAGRSRPVRLNGYVLRSSLVAALGGLLFGFDTAVIAGTTRALVEAYALTPAALGITVL